MTSFIRKVLHITKTIITLMAGAGRVGTVVYKKSRLKGNKRVMGHKRTGIRFSVYTLPHRTKDVHLVKLPKYSLSTILDIEDSGGGQRGGAKNSGFDKLAGGIVWVRLLLDVVWTQSQRPLSSAVGNKVGSSLLDASKRKRAEGVALFSVRIALGRRRWPASL